MDKKLAKLNASPEAGEAINTMLNLINEGYHGGRLTKTQLLSWIVLEFQRKYFERSRKRIRIEHYDSHRYLWMISGKMARACREGRKEESDAFKDHLFRMAELGHKPKRFPTPSADFIPAPI